MASALVDSYKVYSVPFITLDVNNLGKAYDGKVLIAKPLGRDKTVNSQCEHCSGRLQATTVR